MDRIAELAERFKKVKICSDAVDILDEIFEKNVENVVEQNIIICISAFLDGLCVGESLNTQDYSWFTCFKDSILKMFLDRHGYYKNGDKLIKK